MNQHQNSHERLVAAIDLGSNSFHLVSAKISMGGIRTLTKDREKVRLVDGLEKSGFLNDEAIERGIACLLRFSSRISSVSKENIRVVATHTLRKAKNAGDFLDKAEEILNVPVEIIPGSEEARLIFLSVAHTEDIDGAFAVFDVGGGSTEFAYGSNYTPTLLSSRSIGSLTFSRQFFSDHKPDSFMKAVQATSQILKPITASFQSLNVKKIFGTSGTARAISLLGEYLGLGEIITSSTIEKCIEHVSRAIHKNPSYIPGVADDRCKTISAGLAIFKGIFMSFQFEAVIVANSALREGVLYSMDERLKNCDTRERTALDLAHRYGIDLVQAERVRFSALAFLESISPTWQFSEDERQILNWAAMLHEIGLQIAYSGFHRHGSYILANTALPGFNREQQKALSVLVGQHRKKIDFESIPNLRQFSFEQLVRLIRIMRLACLMHYGRNDLDREQVSLTVYGESLELVFRNQNHSTGSAIILDLIEEQKYNEAVGLILKTS